MRKQSDYTLHRSLQEMQVKYDVKEKELEIVRQQHEIENHKARRRLYASGILALTLIVLLMTCILRLKSKHNRELAANNAVKDKLFSIISHDLKSPAVAQKMAVDSMIEELETHGESQSLTERLKAFREATESQLSLLMNLLNWSSLQTGRMAYTPIAFSILETVHKAVDLYRVPAQNKNLNLVIDIPDDCIVVADKQMINTVVRNLLSNAVKFSLPGNEISISVTCHEQSACVRIIDHGIGMSPQQIRNLLESGKNISKSGTHGEKGSGLGLIICKELLEKNGSQLHISGDGQKGTDVWFYLPKA
jgi:signal transduction histidine kinase